MKISILLPYKENYTFAKAQAAAIWVSDFYKNFALGAEDFVLEKLSGYEFIVLLNNHPRYLSKNFQKTIKALKNLNSSFFIFDAWNSLKEIAEELDSSYKNLGNIFL